MMVIGKTRNDVPMQVWNSVTEAGKVDFVRVYQGAQAAFNGKHHVHKMMSRVHIKVAHFGDMFAPDDPIVSRITGVIARDDAAKRILPDEVIPICDAKRTLHVVDDCLLIDGYLP
jgi:hypothetical protein